MLKHILLFSCNRDCSYCITKNVKLKSDRDLENIEAKYKEMYAAGHKEIMLTGGEPLLHAKFNEILKIAHKVFDKVFLTTQHEKAVAKDFDPNHYLTAITFSLHDDNVPLLENDHKFYASIVEENWKDSMLRGIFVSGFAGITLNQEQFSGIPLFSEDYYTNFDKTCRKLNMSFRVNRIGHCMKETIILPDLSVTTDFTEFMKDK